MVNSDKSKERLWA